MDFAFPYADCAAYGQCPINQQLGVRAADFRRAQCPLNTRALIGSSGAWILSRSACTIACQGLDAPFNRCEAVDADDGGRASVPGVKVSRDGIMERLEPELPTAQAFGRVELNVAGDCGRLAHFGDASGAVWAG